MEATKALILEQKNIIRSIELTARENWAEFIKSTFKDVLPVGTEVIQNYSYAEFRLDKADLFSISFRYPGSISYYTSSDSSEWGLDRLVILGDVAKLFKSNRQELSSLFSKMEKQVTEDCRAPYEILSSLNKQLKELEEKAKEASTLELLDKLRTDGIHFGPDERGNQNCQIVYKFGRTAFNVTSLKILDVSKSGLTCTLEINHQGQAWNQDTDSFTTTIYPLLADKVRMDNVMNTIRNYNKYII